MPSLDKFEPVIHEHVVQKFSKLSEDNYKLWKLLFTLKSNKNLPKKVYFCKLLYSNITVVTIRYAATQWKFNNYKLKSNSVRYGTGMLWG